MGNSEANPWERVFGGKYQGRLEAFESPQDMRWVWSGAKKEQITGVKADGTAATLDGTGKADQLKQAKMIQTSKILFHKLAKSLTATFEKQIIPEMNKMSEDGTRLLHYIIKTTMSTTATAYKNALNQLIELSLKEHSWDIDKLHTAYDLLVATLKAGDESPSVATQMLYLMKAYKTNLDNEEWMAHVRNMDSMINSNTIKDVQDLQDNAKRMYSSLLTDGKWKKPKVAQPQCTILILHHQLMLIRQIPLASSFSLVLVVLLGSTMLHCGWPPVVGQEWQW